MVAKGLINTITCSYCQQTWTSEKEAGDHLARCAFNPDRRGCGTCEHLLPRDDRASNDYCGFKGFKMALWEVSCPDWSMVKE